MPDKNSPTSDMQRIAAYADGELAGSEQEQFRQRCQDDPHAADQVRYQQQLRQACGRVMSKPACCPAGLREMIESQVAAAPDPTVGSPVLARIGRWMPLAVAAVLAIAAVAIYQSPLLTPGPPGGATMAQAMPASYVDRFETRHDECSRSLELLHDDPDLPNDLTLLPESLQRRFGQPVPTLDLSRLGYKFAGVGKCATPGSGAVHLVYLADPSTDHSDAVSLWLRPDDGSLPIEPGLVYTRPSTEPDHHLLIWKTDGMVYYLLGDQPQALAVVVQTLRNVS